MGQGTVRDLMTECVLRLPVEIVPMVRFMVHDELVFSIPRNDTDRIKGQIMSAMTFEWAPPGAELQVPILADMSAEGSSWSDCYRKE
jgi:DNA polymerase-1